MYKYISKSLTLFSNNVINNYAIGLNLAKCQFIARNNYLCLQNSYKNQYV